jgi:tripartite-type tricarboxylate transporter receptor subunit TctC
MPHTSYIGAIAAAAIAFAATTPSYAETSVAEFYHGKQIQLVIGYSPGATYDLYARLVSRYLGAHIPGHPTVVPVNMPGAGSRTAAMYIYSVAPQDGTVLGTADQSLAVEQAMGDPTLRMDAAKLQYVGNPIADNNTTVTWYTSGIKTIDDARKQVVTVGATGGSTSSQFPRAMNALLGTRLKIIYGYPGANDINLAMERGEVQGKGSDSWAAWKATRPEWLKDHKINILVQIGLEKEPDLPDTPLLMDLASNDQDRAVLKLLSTPAEIGRPIFAGPHVPADRIQALRTAFDETMKDPGFLKDAATAHALLSPVTGQHLQTLVDGIVSTPKPIADRLSQIVGQEDATAKK